ncbi:metal-dependent hydrolase [Paenibacillus alkalitolerans]|uniref:metal-dependent hydrolase n=1 Tax=Paenibacillus alkalitolerans TaxID=2799335 RepID=UPI0018F3F884|nr:metal-dependent hydrolase [Paenibacillus alkalitolerans]
MDTGTHFAFGFGLAGLSQLDPAVAGDPWTSAAVLVGAVAGSQAPDFDMLLRLKGNAAYVRNHRGLSHSIPAWFIWTALIGGAVWLFFPGVSFTTIALWVFAAVLIHVLTDLFNSYGTQAFRPFTKRWIAWNIIHIFDPVIFGSHVVAVLLWLSGMAAPSAVFPLLYGFIAVYYAARTIQHAAVQRRLPKRDPQHEPGDRYTAIPTVSLTVWNVVKRMQGRSESFAVGEWKAGRLTWNDVLTCDSHPAVAASRNHPDVAALLSFSSYACASVDERGWGYEVRWVDVRYQYRKQYPFVAVLRMDRSLRPLESYIGWISEEKLERRLDTGMS